MKMGLLVSRLLVIIGLIGCVELSAMNSGELEFVSVIPYMVDKDGNAKVLVKYRVGDDARLRSENGVPNIDFPFVAGLFKGTDSGVQADLVELAWDIHLVFDNDDFYQKLTDINKDYFQGTSESLTRDERKQQLKIVSDFLKQTKTYQALVEARPAMTLYNSFAMIPLRLDALEAKKIVERNASRENAGYINELAIRDLDGLIKYFEPFKTGAKTRPAYDKEYEALVYLQGYAKDLAAGKRG